MHLGEWSLSNSKDTEIKARNYSVEAAMPTFDFLLAMCWENDNGKR